MLLPDLETFVRDLEEARRVPGDHLPEMASQKFVNAIVSLQAECHVSLGHWDRLLALVDVSSGQRSRFRLVADDASSRSVKETIP